MQVSLPSSNNFLMSPLVIFLISASCFADLWCVCTLCITWKPHSQGTYCSFLLWQQQLSAHCTQEGSGRDNHPFWMTAFIYSHPNVQISFGNDFKCWVWSTWWKTECFGAVCALGCTRENRPCSAVVGAAPNRQVINPAVNWTQKGCVDFKYCCAETWSVSFKLFHSQMSSTRELLTVKTVTEG